jgi:hypothetical protein
MSAALAVLASSALGLVIEPRIIIEKALEQNSLIVRFSDARAATIELRLDGKVIASRDATASEKAGEVTFDLDPRALAAGNHKLEVVLLTAEGTRIANAMTKLSVSASTPVPVMLRMPKFGEQVFGEYQIDIAVDTSVKQPYVSLFIDRQFREMRNTPPYKFLWDTTKEVLGWHSVEAWAYDITGDTFKSPSIQVYVNNPGGRTERVTATPSREVGATTVPDGVDVLGGMSGMKNSTGETISASPDTATSAPGAVTRITQGLLGAVTVFAPLSRGASTKAISLDETHMSGQRLAVPGPVTELPTKPSAVVTEVRPVIVAPKPAVTRKAAPPVLSGHTRNVPVTDGHKLVAAVQPGTLASMSVRNSPALVAVGIGTRLSVNEFTLLYDGKAIGFDVSPRAENGIALAPFRHLFEYGGGKVKWDNRDKTLNATRTGTLVRLHIGDALATLNGSHIQLERAAFLQNGRTIVPLSFMGKALDVDVDYDPATGHVLITSKE